ncbi:AAA family ATPase [Aliiroseovarius marinus]|uniref:AAA family ATPase n=1 Tax=Aliiroseovarius marinus TaxID=2500159 RepID=UPI003D7EC15A
MNYIESIEIEGFWGRKFVSLQLNPDLNFLIGPNGSGKTTIINLVSAVLRADIPALYSVQFDKVTIKMKAVGANRKPVIEVAKEVDPKMGSLELIYTVREKASDKGTTYGVEGPYDDRIYQDARYLRNRRYREAGARLSRILSDLVEVNWLSIHRSSAELERRNRREDSYESSIDHKLQDISQAFSNFFSLLNSKAEAESKNFQEHVFLSLLEQKHSDEDVLGQAFVEAESKQSVVSVLRDLGVSNAKATRSVNAHYTRTNEARANWQDKTKGLTLQDAIALSDAARVSEMLTEWRGLQEQREAIFQPRIQFEGIINKLFAGKEIHFDERNKPMVHLETGETVGIEVLSSGEKQLFIILGEALLQEERPVVFISDEPELSLHVNWQSALFEHIRSLNGSCQIISATHSPDIVGSFQDRVIKIEQCIEDVH